MANVLRCLGLVLLAVLLTPAVAFSHTSSVETNPGHGARLATLPAEATITFSEPPRQVDVVLSMPGGRIEVLTPRLDGPTVIVELPATGPKGDYGLSYRVVSADGHPVSGSATFTVATGATDAQIATAAAGPTAPPVAEERPATGASGLVLSAGAALVALVAGLLFWLARR